MLAALLLLPACGAPDPKDPEAADSASDPAPATDTGNQPPSAPEVAITPDAPTQLSDLTCAVVTPSTDPEGTVVTYRYAWAVDGVETEHTDAALPEAGTRSGQTWTCRVVASDGTRDGPAAERSVTLARGYEEVALGSSHGCGRAPDDRGGAAEALCWGTDLYGESTPAAGPFTHLVAGSYATCGLREDGTLACWGTSSWGMDAPPEGRYADAALGWYGAYALDEGGALTAWGYAPTGPTGAYRRVAAGEYDHCALDADGQIVCWGSNVNGEGDAPAGTHTTLTGAYHSFCALDTAGFPTCWGLRPGLNYAPAEPLVTLSSSELAACGLRADGTLLCWGAEGSINDGTPAGTYVDVSVGGTAACARDTEGRVTCWGAGASDPPSP